MISNVRKLDQIRPIMSNKSQLSCIYFFSGDPFSPKLPDEAYAREALACEQLGISWSPINFEAIVYEQDMTQAVRRVAPAETEESAVYRGWMLTPAQYQMLYEALLTRRVRLVSTPEEYERCHYLPRWYSLLEGETPHSIWTEAGEDLSPPHLMARLRVFGDSPVIIKDWVKSRKHEWHEACFIPSAADAAAVARVIGRFLELQGEDLNIGLVFREFVSLAPLAAHPKSGMPLAKEFRLFFWHGQLVSASRYWDAAEYADDALPLDHFQALAQKVGSPFFTMDVAQKTDGEWIVVELGDAQVAELPASADVGAFYAPLTN